MMRKSCDKMLHIRIRGEEVLGDAQPVAPAGDEDAIFLQAGGQVGRHALRQKRAEIVRPAFGGGRQSRPIPASRSASAAFRAPSVSAILETPQPSTVRIADSNAGNRASSSVRPCRSAGRRGVGICVVDQAGKVGGALAGDPVLLQRHAAAVFRGDIEEAGGVGREQPFIGGHGHEIRLHLLHVERQGAAALCQVQAPARRESRHRLPMATRSSSAPSVQRTFAAATRPVSGPIAASRASDRVSFPREPMVRICAPVCLARSRQAVDVGGNWSSRSRISWPFDRGKFFAAVASE